MKTRTAQEKPIGLTDWAYERIKESILNLEAPPGSQLEVENLANRLEISRTPVREAIHKLEREGFLRKLPHGGFAVVGITPEDIEETFGIRCVLERYAARLAAINHREEELKPLEEKITEFQRCLDDGRMEDLPRINTAFHNLLYGLCRSPRLVKMISDLRDQIYRFRRIILQVEQMARVSNEDHRRMLRAIRERDVEKVEDLVEEHIMRGKEIVRRELEKRPKGI